MLSAMESESLRDARSEPSTRPWNRWLQEEARDQITFEKGERVFEFGDSHSWTGWKPFEACAQRQLRRMFCEMQDVQSHLEPLDFLGWQYFVQFVDVFHESPSFRTRQSRRSAASKRTTRPLLIVRGGGSASRRIPGHRAARREGLRIVRRVGSYRRGVSLSEHFRRSAMLGASSCTCSTA